MDVALHKFPRQLQILLVLWVIAGQAAYAQNPGAPAARVAVIEAKMTSWQSKLRSVGSLRAVQEVNVAAEIGGRVERIFFESGQPVNAGDVLVTLDSRSERAELLDLEAQLELAALDLQRIEKLVSDRNVSEADLDAARSRLKRIEAQLDAQKTLIDKMTLRAPFAGRLGIREVNLGEFLEPGSEIVSLQAGDPIYVDFPLPQNALSRVTVGQALQVTVDAYPDVPFTGEIQALDARVNRQSRSVTVRGAVPNAENRLRPGMFVIVQVPLGDPQALITLPTSAPVYSTFGDNVFVVEQEANGLVARRRAVQLGERRGDQVAVVEGLSVGEKVVIAGQVKLREGVLVSLDESLQPFNDPDVSGVTD